MGLSLQQATTHWAKRQAEWMLPGVGGRVEPDIKNQVVAKL